MGYFTRSSRSSVSSVPGTPASSSAGDTSATSDAGADLPRTAAVGSGTSLAVRSAPTSTEVGIEVHSLPTEGGLLVKLTPPREPKTLKGVHVPVDIVLVIDVSGSMQLAAPAPAVAGEEAEDTGLSVLDLVKHASRTIVETLDAGDRLSIVTFSNNAKVLLPLTEMTDKNKENARSTIDSMRPTSATNLWGGIKAGLSTFNNDRQGGARVPAVMVLTDGQPNHMCPPQGYVPKLRSMGVLPATIHTFGFGYTLRSGLLKSIAEVGGGNYAFIPDAGMIGTVFVHAVAHLQSTYARDARLLIETPPSYSVSETTGAAVDQTKPIETDEGCKLEIRLGNLQFGQSRDIFLSCAFPQTVDPTATLGATLVYTPATGNVSGSFSDSIRASLGAPSTLPASEVSYHMSRSMIVSFLASVFPANNQEEHVARPQSDLGHVEEQLSRLLGSIPARNFHADENNASLLIDLVGTASANPEIVKDSTGAVKEGQIAMALSTSEHYNRWGVHYLPSLQAAHSRQLCNSFKDAGPLRYGVGSPLFERCRDRLDSAFDSLPAPQPSNYMPDYGYGTYRGHSTYTPQTSSSRNTFSMATYNSRNAGCFAGFCSVELASGKKAKASELRKGMMVATPMGDRHVVAVLKTPVERAPMVRIGGLVVTPWHPVRTGGSGDDGCWRFPADVTAATVRYTGNVYSVQLEPDADADAHALRVGGVWAVGLGHGLTAAASNAASDVRQHAFFGDYAAVSRALAKLAAHEHRGVYTSGGLARDRATSCVNGFRQPSAAATAAKVRGVVSGRKARGSVLGGRRVRFAVLRA